MSAKGNNHGGSRPGAGRKSKAEEMGLAALLNECFTDTQRQQCIKKLVNDANSRVFQIREPSRRLLLSYTYGQPSAKVEHSGPEGDPIIRVEFVNAK